jgi:hypothetical protein
MMHSCLSGLSNIDNGRILARCKGAFRLVAETLKRRPYMFTRTKASLPMLSLTIAVATLATPSSAQVRPPGASRERVIYECSVANQKYHGSWASTQIARYRACMAEHGEVE